MIQAIEKSKVDRLCELHREIIGSAVKTVQTAIEAGGILVEIKASLPHGEFMFWCERNLPFDIRTAQRYIRCHILRDRLPKNDSVSLLTGTYRLLEEHREAKSQTKARSLNPLEWFKSILKHSEEAYKKAEKAESVAKQFMYQGQVFMYTDLIMDIFAICDDVIDGKINLPVNFIRELRRRDWDKNEEIAEFLVQTITGAQAEAKVSRRMRHE